MENLNSEVDKTFALLDADNKVIVVACVLGNDEELLAILAQEWGAVRWLDTDIYGPTGMGGFFDGEKLHSHQDNPTEVEE
jgi:hypothetical protein